MKLFRDPCHTHKQNPDNRPTSLESTNKSLTGNLGKVPQNPSILTTMRIEDIVDRRDTWILLPHNQN